MLRRNFLGIGLIQLLACCLLVACKTTNLNEEKKMAKVEILKLYPMRTVAYHVVATSPEGKAMEPVLKWITENKLEGTMRLFGFNTDPYPSEENSAYGFGFCATIPEGIEIPSPLYEKRLPGGTYAVLFEYEGHPGFGWEEMGKSQNDPDWEWRYDDSRSLSDLG
jgi:hypothetical protein